MFNLTGKQQKALKSTATVSVLFVCMGNICRSPTAHGIFQHYVAQHGLEHDIYVDSAGTHAYHIGKKADVRARNLAKLHGYNFDYIRARQVSDADFEEFDYIIAMDQQNLDELRAKSPTVFNDKIKLLLDYHDEERGGEVPDPYYRDLKAFELVFDLSSVACKQLLFHLRDYHQL